MKLGVSTWLWTSPFRTDTISLFPRIREMGYTHVEIPIEDPSLIDAEEVAKALDGEGLLPIACGAFGPSRDLTSADSRLHANCFEYIDLCFDMCSVWEVGFLCGPMYSAVGKARLLSAEERKTEWNRAVDNLHIVCEKAGKRGLQIALEPLNRFETDLVNTASDVMRMVNEIDHVAAAVLLDSFHMTIEERDLAAAICEVGDKLIHMQVSENYRGAPGTGQTRWDQIKDGLQKINYQGVVSIESFTPHVQELAGAVCIWKPFADSQDDFARDGFSFLTNLFSD